MRDQDANSLVNVKSVAATVRDGVGRPSSGAWGSDVDHLRWLRAAGVTSLSGRRLLDLGCGSGILCATALRDGASTVLGIDLHPPAVEAADAAQASQGRLRFLAADLNAATWARDLTQALGWVPMDLIFLFDLLEHVDAPALLLRNCAELLAPQGQLVVTTPNCNSWERLLRPQTWSGAMDPQHKVIFTPWSLEFLAVRSGFSTDVLRAPIRKLEFLPSALQPNIGAQIFAVFKKLHGA